MLATWAITGLGTVDDNDLLTDVAARIGKLRRCDGSGLSTQGTSDHVARAIGVRQISVKPQAVEPMELGGPHWVFAVPATRQRPSNPYPKKHLFAVTRPLIGHELFSTLICDHVKSPVNAHMFSSVLLSNFYP